MFDQLEDDSFCTILLSDGRNNIVLLQQRNAAENVEMCT